MFALSKILWNFIIIVMTYDYHDYICNEFETNLKRIWKYTYIEIIRYSQLQTYVCWVIPKLYQRNVGKMWNYCIIIELECIE